MKTQQIRLLDVFVFGPLMMYVAMKKAKLTGLERVARAVVGIGTIVYNGNNYLKVEQASS